MAFKERVPSITIDVTDYMGIGILGETTENRLYRSPDESPLPVSELLSVVYNTREGRRKLRSCQTPIIETANFIRHKEVMELPFDHKYFPVENVKNNLLFDVIYNSIKRIGGKSLLYKLKKIKQKLIPY